ncbi:MFS transporter [Neobacillus bataviensis]|uniref:MFS transporter n=1 Tax=Neobacillus bataviensis TaxID=220685 RepID=A0A561E0P0_9BACI|nr:MFS transporter [Neobacillus bataviensis]TWE09161.1 MFS transporter [Neobacillus bataviensis]
MENSMLKKTPFVRLVIAAMLGVGTSIAPLVLLSFGLSTFIVIRIVGQEHATAAFATATGISGIAVVIFGLFSGVIADKTRLKMGRRRFWMIAGSIGGALSMLALTYASSIPVFIIAICLVNFFYGMVSLSCYAIVPEQVEPEKFGRVSGLIGAAAPAFVMTGQMVMGAFAKSTLEEKMITIIIVQLIGGIVAALLIKDNYFAGVAKGEKKSIGIRGFYPSFKKHPSYTWALLTKLFINFSNAGMGMLTLFYIARFHLSETKIFQLMALTAPAIMLMVVAGILGGFLSDKVKKQKPFVMGAALVTGICLIAFAFSSNITWVIVGNFIFNFGFGMYGAVDNALVNRILPSKENAAKDISIMNTTTSLSSTLVNFAAPALIALGTSLFGGDGYTLFFLVLAVFSILSAVVVLPIPEMGSKLEANNDTTNEIVV